MLVGNRVIVCVLRVIIITLREKKTVTSQKNFAMIFVDRFPVIPASEASGPYKNFLQKRAVRNLLFPKMPAVQVVANKFYDDPAVSLL